MDSEDFFGVDTFNGYNSIDRGDRRVWFDHYELNDSLQSNFIDIDKYSVESDDYESSAKIPNLSLNNKVLSGLKEDTTFQEPGFFYKFDPSMEDVQVVEDLKWLNSTSNDLQHFSPGVLSVWLKWGERNTTIDCRVRFCDPLIFQQILDAKTTLETINRDDIKKARAKSNPFESVKSSIFQNRAAVKIANIDATLNFMFSDPKDENGKSLAADLLFFADICAGPGGFSEYILWRNKWKAKGFGFTLRNEDDFDLHAFSAGETETFNAYYGVNEDGNILDPENIQSLQKYVLSQTNGNGVHFLMADAGLPAEERRNQEIFYKQLYLCQCLAALTLVQEGGHFIVKLFDVFTLYSAGLVYLMYKCFKQITIIKPNASRPGNSERYLIGKYKKSNTETIRDYLFKINQSIWNNGHADCVEMVPFEILKEDQYFFNYLCESNNTIGRNQVVSLRKIVTFCFNKNLIEPRQDEIRDKCLKAWKLPKELRKIQSKSIDETFKQLMNNWFSVKEFMLSPDRELSKESDLNRIFYSRPDWYFVPIDTIEEKGNFIRTFFISYGGFELYYYTRNGAWKPLKNIAVEISGNTLIYADIVTELNADQTNVTALHIIDGMVLGGLDIRHLPLQDRLKMCENFANSLNKPSKLVNYCDEQIPSSPISCKKLYRLNEFRQFFSQLNLCTLKDGRQRLGYKIKNCSGIDRWYIPCGLLFFNNMKPDIGRAFSKTYQKPYFFDSRTGKTFFPEQMKDPQSIFASFKTTFVNRYVWKWKLQNQVDRQLIVGERIDGVLYRCDLDKFIFN